MNHDEGDPTNGSCELQSQASHLDQHKSLEIAGQQSHTKSHYSSSCSSLTSGIGQSDQSISNDTAKVGTSDGSISSSLRRDSVMSRSSSIASQSMPPMLPGSELKTVDPELRAEIKRFVDIIFADSQSISLEKKAQFGQLVRTSEARLLFAMYVDDHRVHSKRVSELTFYSLAQYFSIVLLECLLAEDFRPAKVIMNMMFTYYYEHNIPPAKPTKANGRTAARQSSNSSSDPDATSSSDELNRDNSIATKIYLYTMLKDQQIFKSIRFWTSAFYESVIIERNNHSIFANREPGKLSNERRIEELDCSKNITFGLLGSFIHNMGLLDLSPEFCQEFLDKHSTIADLSDEQLDLLRANMKTTLEERDTNGEAHESGRSSRNRTATGLSTSDKFATFLNKLSNRLNNSQSNPAQQNS